MKKNMGTFDRIFRTLIAVLIGILYFMEVISGTVAIILGTLAIVFLLTSLISTCPLYMPFGLSTKNKCNNKSHFLKSKNRYSRAVGELYRFEYLRFFTILNS